MMVENETNYPPPKKNKIINYINYKTKEQGKALDKKDRRKNVWCDKYWSSPKKK